MPREPWQSSLAHTPAQLRVQQPLDCLGQLTSGGGTVGHERLAGGQLARRRYSGRSRQRSSVCAMLPAGRASCSSSSSRSTATPGVVSPPAPAVAPASPPRRPLGHAVPAQSPGSAGYRGRRVPSAPGQPGAAPRAATRLCAPPPRRRTARRAPRATAAAARGNAHRLRDPLQHQLAIDARCDLLQQRARQRNEVRLAIGMADVGLLQQLRHQVFGQRQCACEARLEGLAAFTPTSESGSSPSGRNRKRISRPSRASGNACCKARQAAARPARSPSKQNTISLTSRNARRR